MQTHPEPGEDWSASDPPATYLVMLGGVVLSHA